MDNPSVETQPKPTTIIPGVAPIKSKYLLPVIPKTVEPTDLQVVEASGKKHDEAINKESEDVKIDPRDDPNRPPLSGKGKKGRWEKKNKKSEQSSKSRKISHSVDTIKICTQVAQGKNCPLGDTCKFSHNLEEYLAVKGEDLEGECVNFKLMGSCPYGFRCRFLSSHMSEGKLVTNEEVMSKYQPTVSNHKDFDFVKSVRDNKIDYSRAETVIKQLNQEAQTRSEKNSANSTAQDIRFDQDEVYIEVPDGPREKKLIDFRNKTYLAPLTTVGNLPFRRLCKEFGVDITCSEMAMTSNLLQGQRSEWSLVRRHKSETIFGVQIAGSKVDAVVRCADLLHQTIDMDFLDINMGCPIDVVYSKGGGSALLDAPSKVGRMIRGMNLMTSCPITVKLRTGVADNKPTFQKLIPKLESWGCQLATLHGRSRQQRYTKLADWSQIELATQLKAESPNLAIYGNGDILSHVDYYHHKETYPALDGVMIGRGALIKPWLFEEIKRNEYWDISSRERLDIIKKFCDYGLEHWGSDTMGVNHTRRYLLEWLSFQYRYIPVGLLEVLPQKMNDRPSAYFGRDDLETLLASPNAGDWLKISEMFLGKAPADFAFIPKHQSNSYDPQG